MNKFSKILLFSLALSFAFLTSCKKDKITNHAIEFKVIASANSTISTITHTNNQGDVSTLQDIDAKSWSSGKINFKSSVGSVSVSAIGSSATPNGNLKVEIYVDGELKKTNDITGTILNISTIYEF